MSSRRLWTLLVFCLLSWPPAAPAMPEFLKRFAADPFSKRELRVRCGTCHVSPTGGGPRNEFGQAFDRGGRVITPALRAKFPDRFNQNVTAAAPSAPFKATWSAANDDEVTIEIGGERFILNRAAANVRREGEPPPELPKVETLAEAAPREAVREITLVVRFS